jgi:hypothetical protein
MWMLVRDDVGLHSDAAPRTLAACPDSDDRGDPWRWSVRLVPRGAGCWAVEVEADHDHVTVRQDTHHDGAVVDVSRRAGEEIVVVPVSGQCLVADAQGPWRRWLSPGDVFVGEGEQDELLRLTLAPGRSGATVVRLTPMTAQPLRWVP